MLSRSGAAAIRRARSSEKQKATVFSTSSLMVLLLQSEEPVGELVEEVQDSVDQGSS
jgi:hypothetical protein